MTIVTRHCFCWSSSCVLWVNQPRIFGVRNLFGGFTCVFFSSGFVIPALTLPCSRGNSEGLYIGDYLHLRIGTSCPQSLGIREKIKDNVILGGGFQRFVICTLYDLQEMLQFDLRIFFIIFPNGLVQPPTGSNMWIHRVCCFYMTPTLDHGWYISILCKKRRQISDGGFAPHLLWQGFKTIVNLFIVMFIVATFIAKSEINGDSHS